VDYAIIADLDYVEQVGTPEIKALFAIDGKEIKKDVIESVSSLDGVALVARVDEAFRTGIWGEAQATWEYIKSRHQKLRTDLTVAEQSKLDAFRAEMAEKMIFILAKGALEAYLPIGNRSKDLDKLIRLVSDKEFWNALPDYSRVELAEIARKLFRC